MLLYSVIFFLLVQLLTWKKSKNNYALGIASIPVAFMVLPSVIHTYTNSHNLSVGLALLFFCMLSAIFGGPVYLAARYWYSKKNPAEKVKAETAPVEQPSARSVKTPVLSPVAEPMKVEDRIPAQAQNGVDWYNHLTTDLPEAGTFQLKDDGSVYYGTAVQENATGQSSETAPSQAGFSPENWYRNIAQTTTGDAVRTESLSPNTSAKPAQISSKKTTQEPEKRAQWLKIRKWIGLFGLICITALVLYVTFVSFQDTLKFRSTDWSKVTFSEANEVLLVAPPGLRSDLLENRPSDWVIRSAGGTPPKKVRPSDADLGIDTGTWGLDYDIGIHHFQVPIPSTRAIYKFITLWLGDMGFYSVSHLIPLPHELLIILVVWLAWRECH